MFDASTREAAVELNSSTAIVPEGANLSTTITIMPKSGMALVKCTGPINAAGAREAAAALWETEGWSKELALWDFREAWFDIVPSDAREVGEFIVTHQPPEVPRRVAWVVAREVDFGMVRIFEVYREDKRTAHRVFRDFDDAVAWVEGGD